MNANSIEARARILEVLSPRTYRAALPNGKRIFAFVPAKDPHLPIEAGAHVLVRVALADFSRGHIVRVLAPNRKNDPVAIAQNRKIESTNSP